MVSDLLVTNPDNIFYLTGFPLHKDAPGREVFLLLTKAGNLFITDGRLIGLAKQVLPKKFTVVERNYRVSVFQHIKTFLQKHNFKSLGFEKNNLTVLEYEKFKKYLRKIKFIGKEGIIEKLRLIKNKQEIEKIKNAAQITDKTFTSIIPYLKPGVSELEIAWKIKTIFNSFKASSSFEPIVASGVDSSIPHYTPTSKKLKKSELVLLDFGAKYEGYCSDMTRVVFIGKADSKTARIYDTVLTAQEKALKSRTTSAKKIDQIARDFIIKAGFPPIPHGVGHGVGISIHEAPRLNQKSKDRLKTGMVFTIEPGIYLKDWGGVRIEDLVVFSKKGIEVLSKTSKKLIEV